MQNKVAVLLPYHDLKNQPYLDLFLRSLKFQNVPLRVILCYSTEKMPQLPNDLELTLLHRPECQTYAQKINEAARYLTDEQHVFLAQDDIILSAQCLEKLIHYNQFFMGIMNALSNCDMEWRYTANFIIPNQYGQQLALKRFMRLDEIKGFEDALMAPYKGHPMVIHLDYQCTYASLIPRILWDSLGSLDQNFVNGGEDVDFCLRAYQKHGVRAHTCLDAFTFHFGGVTSTGKITRDIHDHNNKYFKEKWGRDLP